MVEAREWQGGVRVAARRGGRVLLALWCVGCTPSAVRAGAPIVLPSGQAQNACERTGWYEATPARLVAEGESSAVIVTIQYRREFRGLALFRPGNSEPETLSDVWPKLDDPRLQRLHDARIEQVDAAEMRSLYWAGGGLVGMAGG